MDIEGISKCDKYSYTQVGTAQRAHDLFKDEIRWCSDTDNWYVFDKITNLWMLVDVSRIYHYIINIADRIKADSKILVKTNEDGENDYTAQNKALKYVGSIQMLSHVKGAIEFLKDSVSCKQSDFDAVPKFAGLADGTVLDLLTGKITEGKAEYMLTKSLAGIVKDTVSDEFTAYINAFLPDPDVRSYVQKYCGSALLGHTLRNSDDKRILMVDSVSGTGKSTFLSCLHLALGSYYHSAPIQLLTMETKDVNRPNPVLADLQGVRIAGISEIAANTTFSGDNFKRLSGNDVVIARRPYDKKAYYYTPDFRILVMSNDLPRPDDTDDIAFRIRFRRIRLEQPLEHKDGSILTKMTTQEWKDDVVTWLYQGCAAYLAQNGVLDDFNGKDIDNCNLPKAMVSALRLYYSDNDDMGDFIWSHYKLDADGIIPYKAMHDDYVKYTGDKRSTLNAFCRGIKKSFKRFGIMEVRKYCTVEDEDGKTSVQRLKCAKGLSRLTATDEIKGA